MAESGFEGFEKRLELHFTSNDPITHMGLRQIDSNSLEQILRTVGCSIVASIGNHVFDAYVLSESSLFIYPTKIIIKTCGTTHLLKSIFPFLHQARNFGLILCFCRYTRGNFIFPKSQSFPHSSFKEELLYLEESIPKNLHYRKASVIPSNLPSHSWHVFTAAAADAVLLHPNPESLFTVEICMTELDRNLARQFFVRSGDGKPGNSVGKEMTQLAGIGDINPSGLICDFAFFPCGYSMNGIDGDRYSTIHVTPEDGFSYASFECVGSVYDDPDDLVRMLKKVVQIFRPAAMSVAFTGAGQDIWTRVAGSIDLLGFKCRSCAVDEFPAAGSVVFQTFTARRNRPVCDSGGGR